jgi:carbonic anhydrase
MLRPRFGSSGEPTGFQAYVPFVNSSSSLATSPSAGSKPARRTLLRGALTGAAAVGTALATGASPASAAPSARPRPSTPAEALRELAAGNRRWRTCREKHPDETRAVREALISGQHPSPWC